jgi:NhaP-type Na+/H+ or K+/H+ antiporter
LGTPFTKELKMRKNRFEDLFTFIFIIAIFLFLGLYIYGLITAQVQPPWDCPANTTKITGWSGGRYTVLCIEK